MAKGESGRPLAAGACGRPWAWPGLTARRGGRPGGAKGGASGSEDAIDVEWQSLD